MGSLGSRDGLLLLFLTLRLLLLSDVSRGQDSCSEEESGVEIFSKKVSANFQFKLKEPLYFVSNVSALTTYRALPSESLTISTVSLRDGLSCKPCLRINISVNATGLPRLRGFVVRGLELSENTFHSFRIIKKKSSKIENLWEVSYDCWSVTAGQYISVTLLTQPNYGLSVNKMYYISNRDAKPDFQYKHKAEEKKFEISVPDGPDVYVRLCYQANICEDLESSSKKLINSSKNASLSYENLLPCLCIEAFYTYRDSKREKKCPFLERPEPYIEELLQVSVQEIYYHSNTMSVRFESPCPAEPTVTVCRKRNGRCVTEHKATMKEHGKIYYFKSIDSDHHLCFKFSLRNRAHIKCPDWSDRLWNMDLKIQLFDVLLTISSQIPASFSAAMCRQNQQTGDCDLQSIIYNMSTHEDRSQDLQLSLPRPRIGHCIKLWRSDVRVSHPYLLCSFDFSHKHLGLLALVTSLVIITLILIVYIIYQRTWKIFTAPLWRRTILLVYSPDSAEYKTLICAFADFLHSILGCEVILDLWDMNTVSQIGMLPWFYQKRELVSQRKGKVMIVWTRRSKTMYDQWKKRQVSSLGSKDTTNLFGAALSCLEKDFEVHHGRENLADYTMVYFEGLCKKKDIPKCFRKISRYHLFKDLCRLVSHLQDTTYLSPPCLIKAVAKYLMKKLISSEKRRGLQHHVDICKKRLDEDVSR
ncbi:interleukin-17 receptor E isoform X2 [Bufo bufo]|uniref:interleukin-17 receptor E isoform X2 n=1 Tax=Bufo bufo TaxID=8384 RepID=UPI001ABDED35|nr:interleukin-17 receptor E isoform X2 [Bufo bufo]